MDEFMKIVDCHRKAYMRLLRQANQVRVDGKSGCPKHYGAPVVDAIRLVWEATDQLCSRRLYPFLPELVKVLRRHGEIKMTFLCLMYYF